MTQLKRKSDVKIIVNALTRYYNSSECALGISTICESALAQLIPMLVERVELPEAETQKLLLGNIEALAREISSAIYCEGTQDDLYSKFLLLPLEGTHAWGYLNYELLKEATDALYLSVPTAYSFSCYYFFTRAWAEQSFNRFVFDLAYPRAAEF